MRSFLLLPISLLAAAAAGYGLCRAAGWDLHGTEMAQGAATVLIAAALATVPLLLADKGSPAAVAQACLLGTVIHLFGTMVLAALFWFPKPAEARSALLWWLSAFYFASLLALVFVLVRRVNRATPAVNPPATPATTTTPTAPPGQ